MSVVAETQRAPSGQAPARPSRGRRLQLAAMAFLAYGIALIQRPGEAVVDTRLELSVDPTVFLERVFHLWSATTDFGHVQGGQFNGYLFPMAPWFAAGDQLDIPMWILQRLWLGTLLLLAAWGAARLMDALLERPNLVASSGAALLFALNPYVVLFTSRGTVTLLAHAALPWLMLAVHRGLRRPSAWVMPAAIGLILAASGGGVNAAVIAFALLGPIALAGYEVATRRVAVSAVAGFGWRAAVAAAVGSLWWAIPVLLQSRYGIDILIYTEQPSTIWATTSFPELLRSLGFWGLYTGVGFGAREPFMDVGATYLFNPVVIVATFLVPLFAVATFPLVRGWRYAPFFALLAFLALLAMFTGFPREARLREGLLEAYNALPSLQFLRTTYKGMPLLVLALACLGGAGAAALAERARAGLLQVRGRRLPAAALGVLAVIPLLAALPLVTGRAVDREQAYGSVPEWWTEATADAARDGGGRTMVLPGEMFGWYRWGGTMDPVGPGLRREPLAVRELVPYAGPRSAFLQIAIDDLVQQDRLVPGQLAPLLSLTGVRQVLVARDGVRRRNGALDPAATELALAGQPALRAVEEYGAPRPYPPAAGRGVPPATRPEVTRLRAPGDRFGVRVAAGPATVLEGDAEGVTELAAHGLLDPARPLFLAGDVDRAMLAAEARAGATLVLSDSERRRNFIASRTRGNRGPTLTAAEALDPNASTFDAFPERGDRGRTVAVYSGLRRLASPTAPGWSNFPQYRPYAAMDGRLDTSWRADENVDARRWYMELELQRPRPVQAIEVVPQSDRRGRTLSIWVSANGGPERRVRLADGANRVELDNPELRTLRVRIDKIGGNKDTRGAGGITELRIPGLPPTDEHLRLPAALSDAARGLDLDGSPLAVMLQRTTADFPYRAGADSLDPEADHPLAMLDAEEGLEREFDLPAGRRFEVTGWGSVAADAPDAALDRLAGLPAGWRFYLLQPLRGHAWPASLVGVRRGRLDGLDRRYGAERAGLDRVVGAGCAHAAVNAPDSRARRLPLPHSGPPQRTGPRAARAAGRRWRRGGAAGPPAHPCAAPGGAGRAAARDRRGARRQGGGHRRGRGGGSPSSGPGPQRTFLHRLRRSVGPRGRAPRRPGPGGNAAGARLGTRPPLARLRPAGPAGRPGAPERSAGRSGPRRPPPADLSRAPPGGPGGPGAGPGRIGARGRPARGGAERPPAAHRARLGGARTELVRGLAGHLPRARRWRA